MWSCGESVCEDSTENPTKSPSDHCHGAGHHVGTVQWCLSQSEWSEASSRELALLMATAWRLLQIHRLLQSLTEPLGFLFPCSVLPWNLFPLYASEFSKNEGPRLHFFTLPLPFSWCVHSPGSAVLNTLSFFKITAILSAARNKGTFTIQSCLLKAIRKKWGSGQRRILQTNKNNNKKNLAQLLLIFDMKLI